MQNRNFSKNSHKRVDSLSKFDRNSFQMSNSKQYNFLQDNFNDNFPSHLMSNLPSPINKMRFQLSPSLTQEDILNYSSNTYSQDQSQGYNHRSCAQSPQKENTPTTKQNYFGNKKHSIPDARMLTEVVYKQAEWDQQRFSKQQQNSDMRKQPLRKLNGTKAHHKPDNNNEQDTQPSCTSIEPSTYHSQKCITTTHPSSFQPSTLSQNYHHLSQQYQRMRQQNLKLKRSKEELMNENIKLKREASGQVGDLAGEIECLKEQIYRLEMERQGGSSRGMTQGSGWGSGNNTRLSYSRDGSVFSARGNNNHGSYQNDPSVNLFYVEQLEKQNDHLMRENRRLNEIIMKRLKHSIAE